MKTHYPSRSARLSAFTLVEVLIAMTLVVVTVGLATSTLIFGLRIMYKDAQRLESNASLRTFMSQIASETLNASVFYLFPYYTSLDGSVNLTTAPIDSATPTQAYNNTDDVYDQWIAQGDCLVLVTKTSIHRSSDIKQIRVYYRITRNQTELNSTAALRYFETADTTGVPGEGWGEGTASTSNGHPMSGLEAELNLINLNGNPALAGSKRLNPRSLGRLKPAPSTDRFPIFSTLSPSASPTTGSASINVEFVNGTTTGNLLSSSSFNYTISPRR